MPMSTFEYKRRRISLLVGVTVLAYTSIWVSDYCAHHPLILGAAAIGLYCVLNAFVPGRDS